MRLIIILLVMGILSSCTHNNDVSVWIASPWEHVLQNTPPGENKSVELQAAANEFEPFRLIIHNSGEETLSDLSVFISKLKGNAGEILPANFQLYRANYLHVTKPSRRSNNPAGWYPDALIPFFDFPQGENTDNIKYLARPFDIEPAMNAEVWCDIYIPKRTRAGEYKGTIKIVKGKKTIKQIPVNLEVWDFELPDTFTMKSHFGSLNRNSLSMMNIEQGSPAHDEMINLYHQELLKHRAVPSTPAYVWPEWNEKEGLIERGEAEKLRKLIKYDHFNAIDIPFRFKEDPEKCKAYLSDIADWLRNLGYLDMAYIYLKDEPNNAAEYEIVRQEGKLIKAADPDIKRMCTEQTIISNPAWGDLYGAVDIWCPLWGLWNEKTAAERLELGEELWSYTALCQSSEGTPWWQIDMDPLNFRVPLWLSWHYNISGFLYWSSTYWSQYNSLEGVWEAPYFRKDFWGEGMLVYPGQPAGIKGFVPSIRLKLYRESAEDYEYIAMASKLAGKNEADAIVRDLVTNFQTWSRDNNDYINARRKLAELIIKNK